MTICSPCIISCTSISLSATGGLTFLGMEMLSGTPLATSLASGELAFYGALAGAAGGLIGIIIPPQNNEESTCWNALKRGIASGSFGSLATPFSALIYNGGCTPTVKYLAASSAVGFSSVLAGALAILIVYKAREYCLVKENGDTVPLLINADGPTPTPSVLAQLTNAINKLLCTVSCAPVATPPMHRDTPS
jgi:hypothetical protein